MLRRNNSGKAIFVGMVIPVILAASVLRVESDSCTAPAYKIGGYDVGDLSRSTRVLAVGIDPSSMTRANLRCLARTIRDRDAEYQHIVLFVFDSKKVVERYPGPSMVEAYPGQGDIVRHIHASYSYDRDGSEEMTLSPIGSEFPHPPMNLSSRVDMRVNTPADCAVQRGVRCLMALDDPIQAIASSKIQVAADVTLSATVRKGGTVADAVVVSASAGTADVSEGVKHLALGNLRTWRFEPGETDLPARVMWSLRESPPGSQARLDARADSRGTILLRITTPKASGR